MRLGEALILRSDLAKRQSKTKLRINGYLVHQEGDSPAEDPEALLHEWEEEGQELMRLVAAINHTNARARVGNLGTMTDALAERDRLRALADYLRTVANNSVVPGNLYSRSEIKKLASLDAAMMQRRAEKAAEDLRKLEVAIQAANWSIELDMRDLKHDTTNDMTA